MRSSRFTSAPLLAGVAALLAVAFVAAPRVLAARGSIDFASEDDIRHALRPAFADYYDGSSRGLTPDLQQIVDYWFRYHVVKAVVAAILFGMLCALATTLWRRRGTLPGIGAAAASALAVFAALLVMANLQGATAPFAAVFPMLLDQPASDDAAHQLESGTTVPPLDAMVDDFARYHVAMAVMSILAALVLCVVTITAWRLSSQASDIQAKRLARASVAVGSVLIAGLAVLAVANSTTAADPAPGLLALLQGGW